MKKSVLTIILLCAALCAYAVRPYSRWEGEFAGPSEGNPFVDVDFGAKFCLEGSADTLDVPGFYDGEGMYRLRYMPLRHGKYQYITYSNSHQLNGISGSFECDGSPDGHGPVRPDGRHAMRYDDSTRFSPFGTTAYSWIHMPEQLRRLTIESLDSAGFNKVRMCVLPKNFADGTPGLYPFEQGAGPADSLTLSGRAGLTFDLSRFNPEHFRNLERCVDSLRAIGVEADLILFHPYDKGVWGFDAMPRSVNHRYLRYVVARLASFANVWWSMANEYDYIAALDEDEWMGMIDTVAAADPYGHMLSVHGSTATYFPLTHPAITHASIQDEAPVLEPGRAAILWSVYRKPVVLDEVCYEGNLTNRWGRLSGEEMLYRIWNGLMGGTFVTHGEVLNLPGADAVVAADGGRLRGESWRRIRFARSILDSMPAPLRPADISRDSRVSTAGPGYYLIYFGKEMMPEWEFDLPARCDNFAKLRPGTRLKAEIIDTWNMTVTPVEGEFVTAKHDNYRLRDRDGRRILLPLRPYMMIRITPADTTSTDTRTQMHEEDVN